MNNIRERVSPREGHPGDPELSIMTTVWVSSSMESDQARYDAHPTSGLRVQAGKVQQLGALSVVRASSRLLFTLSLSRPLASSTLVASSRSFFESPRSLGRKVPLHKRVRRTRWAVSRANQR